MSVNFQERSNHIWRICDDVIRDVFKEKEYGDVILPFILLRRLDCVLEQHKDEVIKRWTYDNRDEYMNIVTGEFVDGYN